MSKENWREKDEIEEIDQFLETLEETSLPTIKQEVFKVDKYQAIQERIQKDISKAESTKEPQPGDSNYSHPTNSTKQVFGPEAEDQDEEEQASYTEDESATVWGDVENLPPGEFFEHPSVNLLFKKEYLKYLDKGKAPDEFFEKVEAQIEKLSEVGWQDEDAYENAQNGIELLEQIKEKFPEMGEQVKKTRSAEKENYNREFEKAKATGDWETVLALKGALPMPKQPDPVEVAHQQKIKAAIERARKTGDWSYVFRLKGI